MFDNQIYAMAYFLWPVSNFYCVSRCQMSACWNIWATNASYGATQGTHDINFILFRDQVFDIMIHVDKYGIGLCVCVCVCT